MPPEVSPAPTKRRTASLAAALLFAGILIGLAGASLPAAGSRITSALGAWSMQLRQELGGLLAQAPTDQRPTGGETIRVVGEESQVIDVVKRAAPAVVSIVAAADVPNIERCYRTPIGFEDDFFGDIDFRIPGFCQRGTTRQRVGAGSGFLVSADGYILTNKHVIDNDRADYTVILNDAAHKGEKVTARVVAKDPGNDIAVLKIERTGLPFLQFGDSSQLQVGATAIAIGYALGEFDNTVSKGVISGLSRSIRADDASSGQSEQLEDIIQTDAAINPGNSGGPLLDIAGNVIGMNVAMASAQSIGFAIPANEVRAIFTQVQQTGTIERPYLGIRYRLLSPEAKEAEELPVDYGAQLTGGSGEPAVLPDSPAAKAGLKAGDIILSVDSKKITTEQDLASLVAKTRVGQQLSLTVLREGKQITIAITVGKRP